LLVAVLIWGGRRKFKNFSEKRHKLPFAVLIWSEGRNLKTFHCNLTNGTLLSLYQVKEEKF